MAKAWIVGDVANIAVNFSVSGVATDPTGVDLLIQTPAGVTTTYTYASGAVLKNAVGSYYRNVPLDAEGTWYWRWRGTGAATAADEGEIIVKPSVFV